MAQRIYVLDEIAMVGRRSFSAFSDFGGFWRFTWETLRRLLGGFIRLREWRLILPQMFDIGVKSVGVVMITGMFVGMVLAVQSYAQFALLGFESYLGAMINISVVKELGPVLAATMLAGRVGGAMTAELGTMNVTEQIDALRTIGADPIGHLVVPRFLACVLLIPFLVAYTDAMGLFGGYFISVKLYGINSELYWRFSSNAIVAWDVFSGLFKSVFFGGAIALIGCYKGFTCGVGASGVGRACTEAFVASFIAILALDFFLTVLLKNIYENIWGLQGMVI